MTKKSDSGSAPLADPDDAPELTAEHFKRADIYDGETLVRRGRGRPKSANRKVMVSVRLDPQAVEAWRATGPGWQSRMDTIFTMIPTSQSGIETVLLIVRAIEDGTPQSLVDALASEWSWSDAIERGFGDQAPSLRKLLKALQFPAPKDQVKSDVAATTFIKRRTQPSP